MLHFCSGSLAPEVQDTAMKVKDLTHHRSVYLPVYWVSLFAAKKHLMWKNDSCQTKCVPVWSQSRRWTLKLWSFTLPQKGTSLGLVKARLRDPGDCIVFLTTSYLILHLSDPVIAIIVYITGKIFLETLRHI